MESSLDFSVKSRSDGLGLQKKGAVWAQKEQNINHNSCSVQLYWYETNALYDLR